MYRNKVYEGDCLEIMKQLPDNSITAIVTDPPYELGFMGKKWDGSLISFNSAVWAECLRIVKPGGFLMACGGTRTYHRLATAIEDAGWEIRDCISYYHDGSGQQMAFWDSLNDEQKAAYLELHYPALTAGYLY